MDTPDGKPFASVEAFTNELLVDTKSKMQSLTFNVQENFCQTVLKLEECKSFHINKWNRPGLSEGITQILEDGDVFEKIGICVSKVNGVMPPSAYFLLTKRKDSQSNPTKIIYSTTGISGVVYPKNPHIPIFNFNYRYIEMNDGTETIWWFSGGSDLTPCILNKDDCTSFHKVLKKCCDKYSEHYYKAFKKDCDDYFFLEHRGERLGVGGIFFKDLNYPSQDTCFEFVKECMQNILPSYMPIVLKNMKKNYRFEDREWQQTQRGRFAEFYLVGDKSTKLLLKTPGVECNNVLMFLPPSAKWHCNIIPNKTSKEFELLHILRNPVEWV